MPRDELAEIDAHRSAACGSITASGMTRRRTTPDQRARPTTATPSTVAPLPAAVLGVDKNDRARSRFDTAHEIGHLVMHGDQVFGIKEIEQQAHWFSAALLMPADEIGPELLPTLSWPALFDLKQRWQVSLAALLMRARTLRRHRRVPVPDRD